MNSNLNVSDQKQHRSLFSTSNIQHSQNAGTIRHNKKESNSQEAFGNSDGKYRHKNFIHWNDRFQQKNF